MAHRRFLAAFLVSAIAPSVYGTEGDCLVREYGSVTNTPKTQILSLIRADETLTFVVEFKDHSLTFWRDWVKLNNSLFNHGKVRDGEGSQTTQALPQFLQEGWSTLLLETDGARFELKLLGGNVNVTLLDLVWDFPVSSVHVMGMFSFCSGGSPAWNVAKGQVVSIPLQPESNHTLLVTSKGKAAPYLQDSSSSSEQVKNISANTNLTIIQRRRHNVIEVEVEVSEIGTEKVLMSMEQPPTSPTVHIGCREGDLYLRLNLFAHPAPATPPAPPTTKNSRFADSSGDSKALWPMGFVLLFGGIALGCLLGGTVALLVFRQMARRVTTSGAADSPSTHEEKSLFA